MIKINSGLKSLAAQLIALPLAERGRLVESLLTSHSIERHVYQGGAVTLTLLHRVAFTRMQVELCHIMPGTIVAAHCHPNIESVEVPLTGSAEFFIGHKNFKITDGRACNYLPWVIPCGVFHGGRTLGTEPSQFLSIQFWRRMPMSSVGDDWAERPR